MRDRARERAESAGAVFLERPRRPRQTLARRAAAIMAALLAVGLTALMAYALDRSAVHASAATAATGATPAAPGPGGGEPPLEPPANDYRPPQPIAVMQPFPDSGTTQWYRPTSPGQQTGILRILDISGDESNKVARIRDAFGTPVAQTYMRGGEGVQLVLPVGLYQITIAMGQEWYGPEQQFGEGARFYRGGNATVVPGESNVFLQAAGTSGTTLQTIDAGAF